MLFNRLFDLDLLDLKPCPARHRKDAAVNWAICVYLLINWGYFNIFLKKSQTKNSPKPNAVTEIDL